MKPSLAFALAAVLIGATPLAAAVCLSALRLLLILALSRDASQARELLAA